MIIGTILDCQTRTQPVNIKFGKGGLLYIYLADHIVMFNFFSVCHKAGTTSLFSAGRIIACQMTCG